jgi:hypothetical protein
MGKEEGPSDALENDDEDRERELESNGRREEEGDTEGVGGHFGRRCEARTQKGAVLLLTECQIRTSDTRSRPKRIW